MTETINWQHIQEDYETSRLSLRSLATKHGVKLTTLHDRIKSEQWHRTIGEQRTPPPQQEAPPSPGVIGLADAMIGKLQEFSDGHLTLVEIKLIADSLSQFNKIKITAPAQPETITGPQLLIHPETVAHMTVEERDALQELLKVGRERMQTEENAKLKRA